MLDFLLLSLNKKVYAYKYRRITSRVLGVVRGIEDEASATYVTVRVVWTLIGYLDWLAHFPNQKPAACLVYHDSHQC